jgi:YVTN family beta-propeller protein
MNGKLKTEISACSFAAPTYYQQYHHFLVLDSFCNKGGEYAHPILRQALAGTAFGCPPVAQEGQEITMKRTSVWLSLSVVCSLFLLGMALLAIPAQAQTFAYVTNEGSNSVSVIDTSTNTVVATVGVGTRPFGVAVTPDGTRAYVTNNIVSGSVSVIDTSSRTVVATIGVGANPLQVAITPDGTRAYVTNIGSNFVSVIDTSTNTVVATVPDGGTAPFGVAITPDGTRAYVGDETSATVSVIDTSTNTLVATVPCTCFGAGGVAITPDGTRAYVTTFGNSAVQEIDTSTNTPGPLVFVGGTPFQVAITPDGSRAYVPNESSVSVINTSTNTVVATVADGGTAPFGVAITPDGTRAYVTNIASNSVSVIDTSTNTVVATVPVATFPIGVAITPGIGPPTNKDQCKDGGWKAFTIPEKFKNQGDCVSFVNTGK